MHTITAQEVDKSGQVIENSSGAIILGSTRSEKLTGTAGDDLFVGRGGQDTFVFAANFGNDVIKDFDAIGKRHDVLEFNKTVFDSYASELAHATQSGNDDTLLLKNTKLSALDTRDFHFA